MRSFPFIMACAASPVLMAQAYVLPQAPMAQSVSEAFRMGFSVSGAGARATGMGGAFVGVADDGTAASFNPAGLAQLRTFELSAVARKSSFDMNLGLEDPSLNQTGYVQQYDRYKGSSPTDPQFFSFSAPMTLGGRNLVLQVSRQHMFGMNVSYDRQWLAISTADPAFYRTINESVTQKGDITRWTVAGGYEVSPRILVGLAWNHWGGSWTFDSAASALQPAVKQSRLRSADATLNQSNHLEGQNWTTGLLWRGEQVRVGLSYQAAFTAKYRYNGWFSTATDFTLATFLEGPIETTGHTYEVHWPETLSMGFSYRPHPQWQVAMDWSRTPWDKMKFNAPGAAFDGLNFLDPAPPSLTNLAGTAGPSTAATANTYRLGFEHILFVRRFLVPLRAGFFVEPQPMRDVASGENRVFRGFTMGTGIKVGDILFDLAYKHGRSTRKVGSVVTTLSEGDPDVFGLTQGLSQERVTTRDWVVSAIYQFKGEWLKRASRWLLISTE